MKRWLNRPLAGAIVVLALTQPGRAPAAPTDAAEAAMKQRDYSAAFGLLAPLAAQGDAQAEYDLGVLYATGRGVARDEAQGAAWNRKAAAQGQLEARRLAFSQCMFSGVTGDPEDCTEAAAWLRQDAEDGDAKAETMLGLSSLLGMGVPKDPAQAVSWLTRAADQGDRRAEVQLAQVYGTGLLGVPADEARSFAWYRKAADQGDASAEIAMGMKYEFGRGVPEDRAQALAWYLRAAEQNDPTAETFVARMYEEGVSGPPDEALAVDWYRKLAEQGLADAEAKVGTAYAQGRGVARDYLQAYVWLDLAAADKDELGRGGLDAVAVARDSVAGHLTPAELAEARRQVAARKQARS